MKELYIIRGIPGSGKTTAALKLKDSMESLGHSCVHYEADQYFEDDSGNYNYDPSKIGDAHSTCQKKVEQAMKDGIECIIVANTFTTLEHIQPYLDFADEYGYNVHVHRIVGRNFGKEGISKREQFADFKNVHEVPDRVMDIMANGFEDYPGETIVPNV